MQKASANRHPNTSKDLTSLKNSKQHSKRNSQNNSQLKHKEEVSLQKSIVVSDKIEITQENIIQPILVKLIEEPYDKQPYDSPHEVVIDQDKQDPEELDFQVEQQAQIQYDTQEKDQTFSFENQDQKEMEILKIEDLEPEDIVDPKYGDCQIDLKDLNNIGDIQLETAQEFVIQNFDPSRPADLNIPKQDQQENEPLPSYSNRVSLQEFSVGNYKEFKLKEDLANLIEKYNKQFNGDAKKPAIRDEGKHYESKEVKYRDKMIVNPIAVPNPGKADGNYSWMYLMTPHYNQLSKEFQTQQMENHILQQHYEYFLQMEKEKQLLNEEFELLKQAEKKLQDQMNDEQLENCNLEDKVFHMERNLKEVHPERFKELNEKSANLSNVLKSKDNIIDQLLNEISLVKNEKDDVQNEALFKKQRIDNLNIEFNTKELEYQRLWEEEQNLKQEVRGEDSYSKDVQRENELLMRELAIMRDEINQNQAIYDNIQENIYEQRGRVQNLENRLRYGNDVIQQLETENQQVDLDVAQQKAYVESQNRAYNDMRHNFSMLRGDNNGSLQMSTSNPIISIPKIVMPSTYYRPRTIQKATINLLPSTSIALSQQVTPSNIKKYLSVKKAMIDLTSDLSQRQPARDHKVRFNNQSVIEGGLSNLPARSHTIYNERKRADSVDYKMEQRNYNSILKENGEQFQSPQQKQRESNNNNQQIIRERGGSINRNFIDSIGGILGMSEEKQNLVNLRASLQSSNTFPLKRVDAQASSPQKSILKDAYLHDTPEKRGASNRTLDTNASSEFHRETYGVYASHDPFDHHARSSTMSTQTPLKNKITARGGPGNRSSQPQQFQSVKQKPNMNSSMNQKNEEEKYRQSTWQERMSQLPKQSAYKSSITFGEEGVTTKDDGYKQTNINPYRESTVSQNPFQVAKDYDIDIQTFNESDPQAKVQVIKFKQQKIYELTDKRKLVRIYISSIQLQSQAYQIPDNSKQMIQRQKKCELDAEIEKMTKRISMLKYDVMKLTCKEE